MSPTLITLCSGPTGMTSPSQDSRVCWPATAYFSDFKALARSAADPSTTRTADSLYGIRPLRR